MKSLVIFTLLFYHISTFSFPPEKTHAQVVPFLELKQALTANFSNSPFYIDITKQLNDINRDDTTYLEVTIPEIWKNREVFICFEGKRFDFDFFVNNQFISTAKDTQNLAEWRLNRLCKIGANSLKFKSLSRKNMFYHAYIYSTPKLLISNFKTESILDLSNVNGILDISGELRNLDKKDYYKYSLEFALYDANRKVVFNEKSPAFSFGKSKNKTKGFKYNKTLMNVHKWSLANPYLYTLIINMRDGDDNSELEILSKEIAFRSIQLLDSQLYINQLKRPLNAISQNWNDSIFSEYQIPSTIASLKRKNTNIIFYKDYLPNIWYNNCLKEGLLPLPDTSELATFTSKYTFKVLDIAWADSSKNTLIFKNWNLECDQQDIICHWSVKSEAKQLLKGSFKINYEIGEQKKWLLPESVLKIKNEEINSENLKIIFTIRIANEEKWHSKNFVLIEKNINLK
ncbi:MAG: hypothetical protein ACKVOU_04410 [Cytophagales bacterium]